MSRAAEDNQGLSGRREFLARAAQALIGVSVVGVATPLLEGCGGLSSPTATGPLQTTFDVSALTQDGQALVTKTPGPDGAPILIVLQSAGSYEALSMRCTHLGCTVFPPRNGEIVCPCHGSVYDMNGNVVFGPSRTPLHHYPLTYDPTTTTVTLQFG
jgi:cytochrome b6-f complex iron-sulfur subunit